MTSERPSATTRAVQGFVSTRVVSEASRWISRNRLRVIAYHGIGDAGAFDAQLRYLTGRYAPVSAAQVLGWLHNSESLPRHAVWVTFDDGDEDLVRLGLPLLRKYLVPATLFVCPALIDTDRLHWWQAVERAGAAGVLEAPIADVLGALKVATDPDRRRMIDTIDAQLQVLPNGAWGRQLSSDDLRTWIAAGNNIGNHSFDHPLLDRCSPGEQMSQVQRAHDWLCEFLGEPPTLFAWPNGDPADAAFEVLRELRYRAVLVCDHRLVGRVGDHMALSRVRVDADDSVARLRSVVSGAHPAVFHMQHRLRALLRRG